MPNVAPADSFPSRQRVIDRLQPIQCWTSMDARCGFERGTAPRTVNLPVPLLGKTARPTDTKDVWFVGLFQATSWQACYIGLWTAGATLPGGSFAAGCLRPGIQNQFI